MGVAAPQTCVKQASGDDEGVALPLLERFFLEEGFTTPREQVGAGLRYLLEGEGSAVFLAWQGGAAVGVATVTTTRGIEFGLAAEMEDLYVRPEARGQGVATALIAAVKNWCRERGCSVVSVVVTPEGEAAHGLIGYYGRRGFQDPGRALLLAQLKAGGIES